jgi:hypothetical protein
LNLFGFEVFSSPKLIFSLVSPKFFQKSEFSALPLSNRKKIRASRESYKILWVGRHATSTKCNNNPNEILTEKLST